MITDAYLYAESQERDIIIKGYHQVTYGYPRSYYKISHYTDKLLRNLSHPALILWHHGMHTLSYGKDIKKSITVTLKHSDPEIKELIGKSSFYKGIKELVRYRLLLETDETCRYIVNIDHAHKLNSPGSYPLQPRKVKPVQSDFENDEPDYPDDPRPLFF